MYRRRFYPRSRFHADSEEELGQDRLDYMNPTVNYDKWPDSSVPRRVHFKWSTGARCASQFQSQSHHGSIREHQRLLNLCSSRNMLQSSMLCKSVPKAHSFSFHIHTYISSKVENRHNRKPLDQIKTSFF